MLRITSILLAIISVLGFFCGSANADIIVTIPNNLTLVMEPAPGIQQNDQGPCVIGDPSCGSNDTIDPQGFELLPVTMGQTGDYFEILSPIYSVGQIRDAAGDMFSIGIDINQANGQNIGPHQLLTFVAIIDMMQVFAYNDAPNGTALDPLNNPGNGFSDWRLEGFDLTGYGDDQNIRFGLDLLNVSGGRDQFFLVAGPTTSVPEPSTLALIGIGLAGMGLARRRRTA